MKLMNLDLATPFSNDMIHVVIYFFVQLLSTLWAIFFALLFDCYMFGQAYHQTAFVSGEVFVHFHGCTVCGQVEGAVTHMDGVFFVSMSDFGLYASLLR